ncbi:DNA-binding protein [Methanoculleus taiwanensis]|uniref:DNA-binding protein n=1 Tax=Methanoculleus taiwanensis TaxID=1550565 RepID=A0A498GY01_9EURY|nr:HEPN domain-containing protein [Methanoculleus taiwanensis]RXE55373.1 DNA-binding protein [Methanoculleus taiwanensis]
MRWKECLDRGLIRSAPGAQERVPGSLESAARFLRAAEKNVVIEEYEMAHLAAYNSAFHSVRAFLYAAGYVERSHACLVTAVRYAAGDDPEVADLLNAFDKLRIARHNVQYSGSLVCEEEAAFCTRLACQAFDLARRRLG